MVFVPLWFNAHLRFFKAELYFFETSEKNRYQSSSFLNDSASWVGTTWWLLGTLFTKTLTLFRRTVPRQSLILNASTRNKSMNSCLKRLLTSCSRKFYLITSPQQPQRKFILTIFRETFIKMLIRWIHNGDNILDLLSLRSHHKRRLDESEWC